jgi:hypothetical protein
VELSTGFASIATGGPTGFTEFPRQQAGSPSISKPVFTQLPQQTVTAAGCLEFKSLNLEATAERRKSVDRSPRLELLLQQEKTPQPELSVHQLVDLLNFVTGDPHPEMIRAHPLRRLRYFSFHASLVNTWRIKSRIVIENWCDRVLEIEKIVPERHRGGGRKPSREVPRLVAKMVATVGSGSW